jgi:hypothetical protein
MDQFGYPTEEELARIRAWPYDDFTGLLEFVNAQCWWPRPDSGFTRNGREFRLATGGWSGNEEVISALNQNSMFNALCWQSSHRGGLHIYRVPEVTADD